MGAIMAGCGEDNNTTIEPSPVTVSPAPVTVSPAPVTVNNPAPATTATLTAVIAGRVVDSASGAPIPNATVSANAPGVVATVTTDAQGAFALQNVPRTEVNSPVILTVTGGTAPAGRSYPSSTNAVVSLIGAAAGQGVVEPTVTLAGVEIELHDQGGTITGTILDTTGRPVQGVNITLDVVQIPVITPGVGVPATRSGVFPFTLAPQTATTNAQGVFTFNNVPEDWIYDIVVIPGGGSQNLVFTNQYLPSGSRLNFPDVFGPPADSSVVQSFALAGVLPGGLLVGVAALGPRCPALNPAPFGGAIACAGGVGAFLPGGPVVVVPAILPGDSPDQIPPFVVDNSPLVDGTVISAAQNTPGLVLNVTLSEPIINGAQLGTALGLVFGGLTPGCGVPCIGPLAGTPIPFLVGLDMANTTLSITPQVFDTTNMAIALSAGVYSITGLGVLQDQAGNAYTGLTPSMTARGGFDAAGAVEFAAGAMHDLQLDFIVLGDTNLPGAPPVAGIMCTDCQSGGMAGAVNFTATFDTVMGAVLYVGAFATQGDGTFTALNQNLPGTPFAFTSAGPLADPPESVQFMLGPPGAPTDFTTTPGFLLGFTYPLVAGTETLPAPVPNNYFDDGISYQIGILAQNAQGILGPQATSLVRDNTGPGFDTSGAPVGMVGSGNDINTVVGVGVVPATTNMVTPFIPLENVFSSTQAEAMFTAESVQIREGPTAGIGAAIAGTVGLDFFAQIVAPPRINARIRPGHGHDL